MDIAELGFKAQTADLDRAARSLDNVAGAARRTETATEKMTRENERAVKQMRDMQSGINSVFGAMRNLLGVLGVSLGVKQVIEYSDAWKQVNNQLRQVTGSESQLIAVRENLLAVSLATNTELDSTVALYSSLSRSTKELGLDSNDLAEVTKTVNNLFLASGTSAMDASNAIRQLSQGLAAGALRGDEFNSVSENAPRIMDAIAAKLKLTRGELREFAAEGGITSKILVESLQDYNEEAQRMADQTDRTFGHHMVNAKTNMTAFIGGIAGVDTAVSEAGGSIEELTRKLSENTREINAFLDDVISFAKTAKLVIDEIAKQGQGDPWYMKPVTMGPAGMLYRYLGFGGKQEFEESRDNIIEGLKQIRQEAIDRRLMRENTAAIEKWMNGNEDLADSMDKVNESAKTFKFTATELKDVIGDQVVKELDAFFKVLDKIDAKLAGFDVSGMTEEFNAMQQAVAMGIRTQAQAVELMDLDIREILDSLGLVEPEAKKVGDSADAMAESWQAALERIDNAFVELWKSAFDGFDDFGDALKDAFIQLLAELAHRATTQKILVSLGLDYGQGGPAQGAGDATGLNNVMGLGSLAKGLDSLGSGVSSITSLLGADLWRSNAGYYGGQIGGALGMENLSANAQVGIGAIANALAGYAGSWVGTTIGEELFGKSAESAYGAMAGSVIGSIYGPIGAALGGAIGGLIDAASGGDGKVRAAIGVSTNAGWDNIDTMQGASGLALTAYSKRAGDEGWGAAKQMQQVLLATDAALTGFFNSLGITVDLAGQTLAGKASQFGSAADGFFGAAGYNGLDPQELVGATDEFVRAWVDRVNELTKAGLDLTPIYDLQREGELLADVLIRVHTQFAPLNATLEALGWATYELSAQGMAAADGLVAAAGGLENFQALTGRYYEMFYTEQERLAATTEQLRAVFAGLGLEMPTTLQGFRDTVDLFGSMGQAGQGTLVALLGIAPAFHQVTSAAEQAASAAAQLAEQQRQQALAARNAGLGDIAGTIFQQYQDREKTIADLNAQLARIDEQILGVQEDMASATAPVAETINQITASVDNLGVSSSQLRSIADNLLGTVASLRLGNLSPLTNWQRLNEAQSQYDAARRAAEGGDASGLASAAQAYLQQAAAYYASSPAYTAIFDDVTGYLSAMGAELDVQADAAERAERIADQQRAALAAIQGSSQAAVDLTKYYGDIDKLMAEKMLIEQQLANLTAVSSESLMTEQLDRLTAMAAGIDGLAGLLAVLPTSIADGIAGALAIAITDYRALTPTEQFFAGDTPQFAEGGIATGPASGYPVTLHGTEAVIPLKGGAVPVQIDNSAVVAELRSLRQEMVQIKRASVESAEAQRAGVDKLKSIDRGVARIPAGKTGVPV